jgi:hypothetical protein
VATTSARTAPTGLEHNRNAYLGLTRVTFSGLLNALDGVMATEERIVFMTTNHLNRLPPVLIRPGRVDTKVYVGYASPLQAKAMYSRFFPEASAEMAAEFAEMIIDPQGVRESSGVSMAEIQGYLMFFKSQPAECLTRLPDFLKKRATAEAGGLRSCSTVQKQKRAGSGDCSSVEGGLPTARTTESRPLRVVERRVAVYFDC